MPERQTEKTIKGRYEVTDIHSDWTSRGAEEEGKFTFTLILDNGAAEVQIVTTATDALAMRHFILDADSVYWDTDNELVTFSKIKQKVKSDA
jgi:hypothetical protein